MMFFELGKQQHGHLNGESELALRQLFGNSE